MFRFAPIKYSEHLNKISTVIQEEKMNITNDATEIVVELSEGDMRKSLNLLQSLNMSYTDDKLIDKKIVYQAIGYPTEEDRMMIIDSLKGLNLTETYNRLNQIELDGNLSNQDIIREIINYYSKCDSNKKISHLRQKKLIKLFDELAKIEINLSNGVNNDIQLLAISAAIYEFIY
jgi:replication factor C subunit 3/5